MPVFMAGLLSSFACAVIVFLLFESVIGQGNETDQLALLQFKVGIGVDPLGVLNSWNTSIHFCQWYGVTCGKRHQRVTVLDLNSLLLHGSISPFLGNLTFLRILQLQNNSFRNEIPPEIGYLHRLQVLLLGNNLLSGELPANISGCPNLVFFDLGYNKLSGNIPEGFGSLSKLRYLSIQFNNLTGGIPSFLGNLSSLDELLTNYNNFGGSLPDSFGQLKKLTFLAMYANLLSGIIPPSIYNISSMVVICMPVNQLVGTLPSGLGNKIFPSLQELNIGDNQFTGSIPVSLSNASNLERLTIAINGFTGNVPSLEKLQKLWWLSISTNHLGTGQPGDLNFLNTVSNASSLQLLAINHNNFGGLLPSSITNFTELKIMTLEENQLFGRIPTGFGKLVNLRMLYMGDNQLTGEIPEEIGNLQQLRELDFQQSNFSGNIPSSFGNLTLLTHLYMRGNALLGSIPPSLGKCQNLLLLDLNQNTLSGTIPKEVMSIPSLTIYMGLSRNNLMGSLPNEVGVLTNLGTLDISDNMLYGEIPPGLGNCISLEYLYMQGNFFQGTVPSSLSALKGIRVMDFSRNNLTGMIPEFFGAFHSMERLNLSFNHFIGMVPEQGIFKNSSAISLVGNSKLCGGTEKLMLTPCNFKLIKNSRLSLAVKLIIAASVLFCVTFVLSSLFLLIKNKRVKPNSSSSANLHPQISYQTLLGATDRFSIANLLGIGSFGSVYRGVLADGGTIIAVKVLNLLHPGASKSFKAECEVWRNVRHRNLVKLLTACSAVDYQGNDFKALVYEFMANGSLDDWLHPSVKNNLSHELSRNLKFLQRLDIAIDVSNALEYLHHGCATPIVHCDLKPCNVLLNEDMIGHVGDFGLARLFQDETFNISTDCPSSIGVRGTIGYTAPEYGMGSDVSTFGDVYSYGILLLEMLTGKRPTDEMFKDGLNLHTYAKAGLSTGVEKILDPALLHEIKGGEASENEPHGKSYMRRIVVKECMVSVFEIGTACSAKLPSERMNIRNVTIELQKIKEKLVRN